MYYDYTGYGLVLIGAIITLIAQVYCTSNLNRYKKVRNKKGLTGVEVARGILDSHGLSDIYVTEVKGNFSDHYDPNRKVVRLSHDVFHGDSVTAASVAAHECGHAIQDKEGYFFIKLRGFIFPIVSFASSFGYLAIMIGLLFSWTTFAWFGIALLFAILFFQLITLPVEFDASKRAHEILKSKQMLNDEELVESKTALNAAAYTYVASLATTLLEILRMVMIVLNRQDRR